MTLVKQFLLVSILSVFSFASAQHDAVPGELIVKFKNEYSSLTLGKAAAQAQIKHQKSWKNLNLHQFSMKTSDNMVDVLNRLKQDPNVEYAEPNYYVYESDLPYGMTSAPIEVPESWAIYSGTQTGQPIVAILDSGLDLSHPVFNNTGRVFINSEEIPDNGFDDDGNGYIDDISGWNFINNSPTVTDESSHGTHVAGIALGVSEDVIDFNPNETAKIRVLPLKFLDANGAGKTSDAIEAVYYAISIGAKVISNSWGGSNYSVALHEAFTYAYNRGAIIVSAAGNFSSNNDSSPLYPASYNVPSMISVAATSDFDNLASFSNFGQSSVHIAAPGVAIYSTLPGGNYGLSSGTSMATPFIAGLAAVLLREAPQLSGFQLKEIILDSGDTLSNLQNTTTSSKRMNAMRAVSFAKTQSDDDPFQPSYSPVYQQGSRSLSSTADFTQGFGCGTVKDVYQQGNEQLGEENKNPHPISFILLLIPMFLASSIKLYFKRKYKYQRAAIREKVKLAGQIITQKGFVFPVTVTCWSASGAGFMIDGSDFNQDLGVNSSLTLKIDSQSGKKILTKAQVVRKGEQGFFGIKFLMQ